MFFPVFKEKAAPGEMVSSKNGYVAEDQRFGFVLSNHMR